MKYLTIVLGIGSMCLTLLFGGISYGASDVPALRDAKDTAERARVQSLIDGARKENALDWTGIMVEPKHSEHLIAGLKEYYGLPSLKVNYTYGNSTEVISRVNQVLKAGRTPPDIVWLVGWDWFSDLMRQGKLMRYDSPYYKEYTLSDKAGNSMPGYWVSDAYTNNPMWNVKELEKRGIKDFNPTSWWDFTDPKLASISCLSNIATSSTNASWAIGMRKTVGDDWFIKVGKAKPGIYTKSQQGEQWVASGEYPICLFTRVKSAIELDESGTKVGFLWPKEGQVLFPFSAVILAAAPHPNTAKLFIDYIRSLPGTNRLAETRVALIYGRPGVKIPEKDRKFLPPAEQIKGIPMNWTKEITPESMNAIKEWSKKVEIAY